MSDFINVIYFILLIRKVFLHRPKFTELDKVPVHSMNLHWHNTTYISISTRHNTFKFSSAIPLSASILVHRTFISIQRHTPVENNKFGKMGRIVPKRTRMENGIYRLTINIGPYDILIFSVGKTSNFNMESMQYRKSILNQDSTKKWFNR